MTRLEHFASTLCAGFVSLALSFAYPEISKLLPLSGGPLVVWAMLTAIFFSLLGSLLFKIGRPTTAAIAQFSKEVAAQSLVLSVMQIFSVAQVLCDVFLPGVLPSIQPGSESAKYLTIAALIVAGLGVYIPEWPADTINRDYREIFKPWIREQLKIKASVSVNEFYQFAKIKYKYPYKKYEYIPVHFARYAMEHKGQVELDIKNEAISKKIVDEK